MASVMAIMVLALALAATLNQFETLTEVVDPTSSPIRFVKPSPPCLLLPALLKDRWIKW